MYTAIINNTLCFIFPLENGLLELMSKSNDYELLTEAFTKWRQVSGKVMKPHYVRMVQLLNEAAKLNG